MVPVSATDARYSHRSDASSTQRGDHTLQPAQSLNREVPTGPLDLGGCVAPSSAVFVDYLNSSGQVQQRIQTLFSTWFNFIAAPIEHFSIYALDV